MKKDIFDIIKNKKKLKEIRKIARKFGLRLTSSVLMSICILLTNANASRKNDVKIHNIDNVNTDIVSVNSRSIKPLTKVLEDTKISVEDATSLNEVDEETMSFSSIANLKINYENTKPLTNEEKIEIIFDKYNLNQYQLDVCAAIACAEASGEGMNYEETVNVICAAYNRTISSSWVYSLGDNLYDQMTAPNQFVVYQSGSYLDYMERYDLPGYQAVIDFLSNNCEFEGHNYLSFRSNRSGIDGVELVSGGNLYFNELTDEDKLTDIRVLKEVTRGLS